MMIILKHLDEQKMIHRDLRYENFMIHFEGLDYWKENLESKAFFD